MAEEHLRESFEKLSRSRLTGAGTETRSVSSAAGVVWLLAASGLRGLVILARDGGGAWGSFVSLVGHLFFDKCREKRSVGGGVLADCPSGRSNENIDRCLCFGEYTASGKPGEGWYSVNLRRDLVEIKFFNLRV